MLESQPGKLTAIKRSLSRDKAKNYVCKEYAINWQLHVCKIYTRGSNLHCLYDRSKII